MRICIVGPLHPWKGGIAKYLDSLGNALHKEHYTLGVTFSRQYPSFLRKTQKHIADIPHSFGRIPALDMLNPLSWYRTARAIQAQKFDLVIFKFWHPYFALCFGYIAGKLRKVGVKVYFIVDNITPHEWFPFAKSLARYCLSNADLFFTHSQGVTNELVKLLPMAFVKQLLHPTYDYGKRVTVAEARKKLGLATIDLRTKPIILFFGYIRPYKGLDILLRAFAKTDQWRGGAYLLIVGEPFENMDKYHALARKLGIYDRTIWHTHYIPDEEVSLYFSAVDLLVLPYKSATQSGIVEIARSFDLPVIATDVGGLSEQVEKTVLANDHIAIASSLMRFFTNSIKLGYKPTITFDGLAKTIVNLAHPISWKAEAKAFHENIRCDTCT